MPAHGQNRSFAQEVHCMSKSCRKLVEALAAESATLKVTLQDADEYWAPDEPPATTLLANYAARLVEASDDPTALETQRALRVVEAAMASGDADLVSAVATGFIEGLVASASRKGVLTRFLAVLGPTSRNHADRWLAFEG